MSFRGRLRLFFTLIVIVPMIALGIVLFALAARTETRRSMPASVPPHARRSPLTANGRWTPAPR